MKKIVSLALVFIIALTCVVSADVETAKDDVTKYGIITNHEIETVSRAEAVKIIMTMRGYEPIEQAYTNFTDVPLEYWASGYIEEAERLGIINGKGDGTFAPEEKVTNEQMIKMLVCALGYGPMAADRGGYPIGYFMVATQLGVVKDIDPKGTDIAKRSDVTVMVHNALDINVMAQNGFGAETSFVILDGKNGYEKETMRIILDNIIANKKK